MLEELAKRVLDGVFRGELGVRVGEMRDLLGYTDKKLFTQVIANNLTFDQFKTRIHEIIQKLPEGEHYHCYDDLKDSLD